MAKGEDWFEIRTAPLDAHTYGVSDRFLVRLNTGEIEIGYTQKQKSQSHFKVFVVNNGDYFDGGYGQDYEQTMSATHWRHIDNAKHIQMLLEREMNDGN